MFVKVHSQQVILNELKHTEGKNILVLGNRGQGKRTVVKRFLKDRYQYETPDVITMGQEQVEKAQAVFIEDVGQFMIFNEAMDTIKKMLKNPQQMIFITATYNDYECLLPIVKKYHVQVLRLDDLTDEEIKQIWVTRMDNLDISKCWLSVNWVEMVDSLSHKRRDLGILTQGLGIIDLIAGYHRIQPEKSFREVIRTIQDR